MGEITIKFSNRAMYTLVAIGVIILIGVSVYAYGGSQPSVVGHSAGEIEPPTGCTSGQVLQWSGSAWQCATPSTGGIATETDPTVLASVKDGVSWSEITGIPPTTVITSDRLSVPGIGWLNNGEVRECKAICAGHTYKSAIINDNGVLKLRYYSQSGGDSGWIRGYSISYGKAVLEPELGLLHTQFSQTTLASTCDLLTKSVTYCMYGSPGCVCSYSSSW